MNSELTLKQKRKFLDEAVRNSEKFSDRVSGLLHEMDITPFEFCIALNVMSQSASISFPEEFKTAAQMGEVLSGKK